MKVGNEHRCDMCGCPVELDENEAMADVVFCEPSCAIDYIADVAPKKIRDSLRVFVQPKEASEF